MNTVWIVMSSWTDAFAGQMPWWLSSPSQTIRAMNYSVTFTIMFDSCIQETQSLLSLLQTKLISCISKRWNLSMDFSWLTCWAVLSMKYQSVKTTMMSSMPSISFVKKSVSSKQPAPLRGGEHLLFHGQNHPTCRIWREGSSKLCLPKWGLSLLFDSRAIGLPSFGPSLRLKPGAFNTGASRVQGIVKAGWFRQHLHGCRNKRLLKKGTVAGWKREKKPTTQTPEMVLVCDL